MDKKFKWWNETKFPLWGESVVDFSFAAQALSETALKEETAHLLEATSSGNADDIKGLMEKIEALNGRKIIEWIPCGSDKDLRMTYVWPLGALSIYHEPDGNTDIRICAVDKDLFDKLIKLLKSYVKPKKSDGKVYVIARGEDGPKLSSLGVASIPLERNNYENEVLDGFDHIVEDLASLSPCGRLILLNGIPGTGKTFIIRGLLDEVHSAIFVIIPPQFIDSLLEPSMITTLLDTKKNTQGPTIFIVEDADACLVPRQIDNVSTISSVLNLSDGILGSMLDLRIIATTNALTTDIDEAIMRPGRLCSRINISTLSFDKSKEIYFRLTGKELNNAIRNYTLAEIYKMARNDGWKPPKAHKQMGFLYKADY